MTKRLRKLFRERVTVWLEHVNSLKANTERCLIKRNRAVDAVMGLVSTLKDVTLLLKNELLWNIARIIGTCSLLWAVSRECGEVTKFMGSLNRKPGVGPKLGLAKYTVSNLCEKRARSFLRLLVCKSNFWWWFVDAEKTLGYQCFQKGYKREKIWCL